MYQCPENGLIDREQLDNRSLILIIPRFVNKHTYNHDSIKYLMIV